MSAFKIFEQNSLSLKLVPISVREIFLLSEAPCDFYGFANGLFHVVIQKAEKFNPKIYRSLIEQGHWKLFIYPVEREKINLIIQNELQKSARSLSIGNIQQNVSNQTNLLTMSLAQLYNNPMDDSLLKLQFQSVKNLSNLMMDHKAEIKNFYDDYEKQKHYFILSQPLLSSILLLGFLESMKIFSDKEVEALFIASYFKDIGISFVPQDIFNKKNLTEEDRRLIQEHSKYSVEILKNRLPMHSNYLTIIENHHFLNHFNEFALQPQKLTTNDNTIIGIETILMCLSDTIVAATTPRPYREPLTLFQVLDMIKDPVAKNYPNEFKALVYFLRRFFIK